MPNEELSKQKSLTKETEVEATVEKEILEYQENFLRLFQILHQINLKNKIINIPTYEEVKNIRNSDNAS